MRKKTTKRVLLASIVAVVLCLTMLVGTTFAWFTDSVTSTNNIIKSGTLDVEMYWADGTKAVPADDSTDWKDASQGAIFNYDKWEPGYVEVRHIKIANEGTLAFKYKVEIAANGEVSDLANVIDVYYVDPAVQVADRDALVDSYKLGTLADVLAGLATTGNGTLIAGDEDTITLALKMREEAGNEYQNKAIGADFSVILTATQLTYESDSFGPEYDASATLPVVGSVNITTGSTEKTIEAGNVSLTIPAGVPAGTYNVVVSNEKTVTDSNDQTTYIADIDLLKDGVKVEKNGETVYLVAIQLEADKTIVKVLHKGVEVADFDYDPVTGILTFETDSFSPFSVVYKTVTVVEPPLPTHTPAEAVEENRIESTCTIPGSYASVVYCSDCGEELSRETFTLNLAPHTPDEAVEEKRVESTCTVKGSYDSVVYCVDCGEELDRDTVELELAKHSYSSTVVDPTCLKAGSTTYKCSCGDSYVDRIKPLGHTTRRGVCTRCDSLVGVEAESYSYKFTRKVFNGNSTQELNRVRWTLSGNGRSCDYSSHKGHSFSVGNRGPLTLTSKSFSYVNKVTIETYGNDRFSGNLNVYVGNTLVGSVKLTDRSTPYTFEVENLTGEVRFEFSQAPNKTIYVKSISVDYAR